MTDPERPEGLKRRVGYLENSKRKEYTSLLKGMLSKHRCTHSLNVAEEAVRLAKRYHADVEKAETAGLLHDIMKETEPNEQRSLILRYDKHNTFDSAPMLVSDKLLHGPAGAAYCRLVLRIKDEEILNAIFFHTTARPDMTLVEKIVYIADYTSRERNYKEVELVRKLADKSLEATIAFTTSYTIRDLLSKKQPLNIYTVEAYNQYIASGRNI